MELLHSLVWNPITILSLLLISFYFHHQTHYVVFRSFFSSLLKLKKTLVNTSTDYTQLKIMMTSLGAVMGIGNIIGVATAILSGGAGSIFWMVLSSIIISSLKYVEIYLAQTFQRKHHSDYYGGTHIYIEDGLHNKVLAWIYVILLLIVALTMGNLVVSNTLVSLISELYQLPTWIGGIGITVLLGAAIMRGQKSVMLLNSYLVPYMILLYVGVCLGIIVCNVPLFVEALEIMGREAFQLSSLLGGSMGLAVKYGITRGIFSNEAGMGSCTMVHAKSTSSAHEEGMVGVIEVFLDSVVMCFLSGVVLVMSGVPSSLQNAPLFLFAGFSHFLGVWGIPFVCLSLLFFGISSVLGWYVFGSECVRYLGKGKVIQFGYSLFFLIFLYMGSRGSLLTIFKLSDVLNGILIAINVYACIVLSKNLRKKKIDNL